MSDIDFDYDSDDHSPAGLRKALEKALARAKAAEKAAEEASERAVKAEKSAKKSTLTEILRDKGIKPGLAKWLEKDDVEASPEAVDEWVKENGEFFNVRTEVATDQEQEQPEGEGEDLIDPQLAEALQASQRLDESGLSPSQVGTMQRLKSLTTDPSKTSYEELVAELRDMGAPLD